MEEGGLMMQMAQGHGMHTLPASKKDIKHVPLPVACLENLKGFFIFVSLESQPSNSTF